MADHFGICTAITGRAEVYFRSARRTGRTTALLDSLQHGDRVVCVNEKQRADLIRETGARKLKIVVIVVDPQRPENIFNSATSIGRTIFDHSWVEQFVMHKIATACSEIDHLQRESSGRGAAHEKTRMQAEAIARWEI